MKPILKLYRGYANEEQLIVMGHIFKPTNKTFYDFKKKNFKNARSIISLFRMKTMQNEDVYLEIDNKTVHTKSLEDGYFKFCIPLKEDNKFGWIDYTVFMTYEDEKISSKSTFVRPTIGKYGFISDIDDTFLISHTRNPLKKLYILLFKNINSRKVFDDVVPHYQALQFAGRDENSSENAFFYVSSSEWNLYDLITQFTAIHKLPKAVLLLKDIKTSLTQLFLTGRGDHNHKFQKIKHILELYPNYTYVLLGDDSQQDPHLYENICKIFPLHIKAVYIRQVGSLKKDKINKVLSNIATLDIATCYYKSSSKAIKHSTEIGLIK